MLWHTYVPCQNRTWTQFKCKNSQGFSEFKRAVERNIEDNDWSIEELLNSIRSREPSLRTSVKTARRALRRRTIILVWGRKKRVAVFMRFFTAENPRAFYSRILRCTFHAGKLDLSCWRARSHARRSKRPEWESQRDKRSPRSSSAGKEIQRPFPILSRSLEEFIEAAYAEVIRFVPTGVLSFPLQICWFKRD